MRRRAGTRARRGAPRRRASAWCRGRCRRRRAAGAGPAPRRVRRSVAGPSADCPRCVRPSPAAGAGRRFRPRALRAGGRWLRGSARRTSARAPAPRPRRRSSSSSRVRSRASKSAVRSAPTASASACTSSAPDASSSASRHCHLPHQEVDRHGGVALGVDRRAAQPAQVGGAAQRVLQALVGLVDAHRPLHRAALRRGAVGGEAVGVHLGLQGAPARVERGAVLALAARHAEQGEVVVVEPHRPAPWRGATQAKRRDRQAAPSPRRGARLRP